MITDSNQVRLAKMTGRRVQEGRIEKRVEHFTQSPTPAKRSWDLKGFLINDEELTTLESLFEGVTDR